jgi:SEC-C motif-containing protein
MTAMPSPSCPCGSGQAYAGCCGRYHAGPLQGQAPTPEALMRSRYSAFTLDLRAYLLATWHASTRPPALEAPPPGLRWLGLDIRHAPPATAGEGARGEVEFVARSKHAGRAHRLHERSRFVFEQGRWWYLDGDELGKGTVAT